MINNDLNMYVPIEKIDKEKRTVAGWATTEEIDKQNEVVDYEGSKEAFRNWKGNIREMHEPTAVGKAIEIIPNDDNKKVWVKAYISKGAEDTWNKVQEGILSGFSIGGKTIHKTTQIMKEADSNESKTVTRITKYQLNELSLVDNPANPGCSFALVKNVDGTPYQTEVVEDMRKIVITEAEDPLKAEITQHRDKADALSSKVLDGEQLEKLSDDDFGVIRKYTKSGTLHKQRLVPMPDKVHAVRALEVISKENSYNLNEDETQLVHKKAQSILGSAYENYKNLNEGGEDIMSKELAQQLLDAVSKLTDKVVNLEKQMEGAYKPIAGAKENPGGKLMNDDDPSLSESSPLQPNDQDVETQDPEGNYPNTSDEPEKMAKADRQIFELVKGELGEGVDNEDVSYILDVVDYTNKMSDEEFDSFTKSLSNSEYDELSYCLDVFGDAFSKFEKAKNPEDSDLHTQSDMAAPNAENDEGNNEQEEDVDGSDTVMSRDIAEVAQKVRKDGVDSEGSQYPGKHPDTIDLQTQTSEGNYPAEDDEPEESGSKTPINAKTAKDAGSQNDLSKVVSTLDSLRKKVESMDEALKRPQPRKYRKIEKSSDVEISKDEELEKDYQTILKVVQSGGTLTKEQEQRRDEILNERFSKKFNKSL